MARQRILIVVGPTASGKSALAVELAKKYSGEVISADSRQVYKGLNIGTGKITRREMQGIPHHLLDVVSPKKTFTAHNFVLQAQKAIADISARGKLPIVCGGTGFYIDALVGRISLSDVPANKVLRAELIKKSTESLFKQLSHLNPKRATSIDKHNKVRLIRAIEIAQPKPQNPIFFNPLRFHLRGYSVMWVGLAPERDDLRKRINKRLKERLQHGMIAEAKRLKAQGLSYKRMESLGLEYRSLARFLQKKISRQELETELQSAIWQYAKRQQTYWHRNADIQWFKPTESRKILKAAKDWLQ